MLLDNGVLVDILAVNVPRSAVKVLAVKLQKYLHP